MTTRLGPNSHEKTQAAAFGRVIGYSGMIFDKRILGLWIWAVQWQLSTVSSGNRNKWLSIRYNITSRWNTIYFYIMLYLIRMWYCIWKIYGNIWELIVILHSIKSYLFLSVLPELTVHHCSLSDITLMVREEDQMTQRVAYTQQERQRQRQRQRQCFFACLLVCFFARILGFWLSCWFYACKFDYLHAYIHSYSYTR